MIGDLEGNNGNEMVGYIDNLIISKAIRDSSYITNNLFNSDFTTDTYFDDGIQTVLPMETTIGDPIVSGNHVVLSS